MTIVRVKKKKKDFCVIKTELLNNPKLSFKAKGLWSYAMSRPDDWTFVVAHLITTSKEKETAIYSALKELTNEGYCIRDKTKDEKGRWQSTDYVIFETLADAEDFKKCLPHRGFPDVDNPRVGNQALLSIDQEPSTERIYKKQESASPPPSADAEELCVFFLSKIRERNPEFKQPNLKNWAKIMDDLLKKDKRSREKTIKLIEWISKDNFWKNNCLSPKNLKENYDRLIMQMGSSEEKSLCQLNRAYALSLKDRYPEQIKSLSFDDKYVSNRAIGKEVPWNLPHEQFREAFLNLFGGQYVR